MAGVGFATGRLTEKQERRMREQFDALDSDGSGYLDEGELRTAVKALGVKMSEKEFLHLFRSFDSNRDGFINFEEYVDLLSSCSFSPPQDRLQRLFILLAHPITGKISRDSLSKAIHQLGLPLSEDEKEEMFFGADTDCDGEVDWGDFLAVVQQTGFP